MASVVPHLLLPEGKHFDNLLRALIGIVMVQSAYIAKVVRGGLPAIPRGQYEAAEAMGLSYRQSMGRSLDPETIMEVMDVMIERVTSGMTMLCVIYEMGFAKTVADWVIYMDGGETLETHNSEELFNNPQLRRTYSCPSQILRH